MKHWTNACAAILPAVFALVSATQVRASDIDLGAGDSIIVDGNRITCQGDDRPRTWSCSITCKIDGFQDASDVIRPMAASAASAGLALDAALTRCADLDQTYVDAFHQRHPTWPVYIDWHATCGGQEATVGACCIED
jgi:hypothetical protein